MPAQKCLWLDKKEGLFPGPNHPGQKYQEKLLSLAIKGRFTCRRRMISWCRNNAFSATSSALPLVKSASVLRTKEVVSGLIHHNIRSWNAYKRRQMRCLIDENTRSTNGTSSS
ncbi:MAG TPA: hypothetical protein VF043_31065 [Ktedonobacteraceae bacterium]